MKLVRYLRDGQKVSVGIVVGEQIQPLSIGRGKFRTLSSFLESTNPEKIVVSRLAEPGSLSVHDVQLLPPIDEQEVWAAGVTYKRSRTARMEESEAAASCYDRVYESPRPELFIKASPHRVSGHKQPLRIRQDSKWNVPEPELTLVISSKGNLVGFTVGNDMSSRDIEGENPLYLPQAKVYDQCCGLGPYITLVGGMPEREQIGIELTIHRDGGVAFQGRTDVGQMARSFEELIEWLMRDNSFPNGVFLLTGTGIIPESDFTLAPGDIVDIAIDGIGTLSNPIVQGYPPPVGSTSS